MTFDEVMVLTRTVSSNAAFEDEECRAYFDILMGLKEQSRILEIGLQYGRSTAIAAQVAKLNGHEYIGIDPFIDPPDAALKWLDLMKTIDVPFVLYCMRSGEVIPSWYNVVLVDGDHSYDAVIGDCRRFRDRIIDNGYMLFHDYGRESLPEVYAAVTDYFGVELPKVGTLGIWHNASS